jgi:hypothetical protein
MRGQERLETRRRLMPDRHQEQPIEISDECVERSGRVVLGQREVEEVAGRAIWLFQEVETRGARIVIGDRVVDQNHQARGRVHSEGADPVVRRRGEQPRDRVGPPPIGDGDIDDGSRTGLMESDSPPPERHSEPLPDRADEAGGNGSKWAIFHQVAP